MSEETSLNMQLRRRLEMIREIDLTNGVQGQPSVPMTQLRLLLKGQAEAMCDQIVPLPDPELNMSDLYTELRRRLELMRELDMCGGASGQPSAPMAQLRLRIRTQAEAICVLLVGGA